MTFQIKTLNESWTLKVLNTSIPPKDTFKMVIYLDGYLYYNPDTKTIYLTPDDNFKEQNHYRAFVILYKIGTTHLSFCITKGIFEIRVKWEWKEIDPREEKLSDSVKYFALIHDFSKETKFKDVPFPLCDPTVSRLLPKETKEEQINYLKYISQLKAPEKQIISGISNLFFNNFKYVDYLVEFFGLGLYNMALQHHKGLRGGQKQLVI